MCPKAFVELLHLLQEAVCNEYFDQISPVDEAFVEVFDGALSGSMICYYKNSFLHGHVKKIYKALLNSRNPAILRCMCLAVIRSSHGGKKQDFRHGGTFFGSDS